MRFSTVSPNVARLGGEPRGYDVPHQLVEHVYRDTGVRTNPLRGISFLANKFATETFIDEIAWKRGIDPLAFRLELLKNTPRAYKAVERVAQMAEWGRGVFLSSSSRNASGSMPRFHAISSMNVSAANLLARKLIPRKGFVRTPVSR